MCKQLLPLAARCIIATRIFIKTDPLPEISGCLTNRKSKSLDSHTKRIAQKTLFVQSNSPQCGPKPQPKQPKHSKHSNIRFKAGGKAESGINSDRMAGKGHKNKNQEKYTCSNTCSMMKIFYSKMQSTAKLLFHGSKHITRKCRMIRFMVYFHGERQ
jgi:hypothetical protein